MSSEAVAVNKKVISAESLNKPTRGGDFKQMKVAGEKQQELTEAKNITTSLLATSKDSLSSEKVIAPKNASGSSKSKNGSKKRLSKVADALDTSMIKSRTAVSSTWIWEDRVQSHKETHLSNALEVLERAESHFSRAAYFVFYETLFFSESHHNFLGYSPDEGYVLLSVTSQKVTIHQDDQKDADPRVKTSERLYADDNGHFFAQPVAYRCAFRCARFDHHFIFGTSNLPKLGSKSSRLLKAFQKLTPKFSEIPFVELPSKATPGRFLALERCLLPNVVHVGLIDRKSVV